MTRKEEYNSYKTVFNIQRYTPTIIMLSVIAFLTLQSRKDTLSLSLALRDFFKEMLPGASGRWTIDMHWFRSLLHLPLYFALGCVVSFQVKKIWNAVAFCGFVALSDEILKIFLSTREFEVRDLAIDAIGFLIGILCVTIFRFLKMRARVIE